ncbi:IS110 family transposase [Ruminococcus albus]|uniref:Transposase IS116/IS110/IS902 family protein n=4 Tax=Ruminococcus albus TaxID=1264 RepID=E6UAL3_RUMA7|nr:IS110 family transposase [Ruminococcus albus]ADU20905.1 transposase IS116/IS110/IS902 family protein [Ruminococcus albus 7 = DSM 20455]ADU22435.1 transposase IS116/IS110/IS902 family protein [Ruminococcus albus 7 = DSM 20455]ADU23166.1 transposase IS116/IS110/IS902 family protein [Ruminococcus albus 7 = DSM 20455]ADU23176.1 transposase IS116/IS110/IS902 family protein [Ruminococcus albus 7 = DSM 20455]ADU23350.1 transposase IS116/IS110/IS902 family protein [Ruminococcus albus 7 = DSM 20455]
MIVVGIDVAKDKHDCFIVDSEGTVLFDVFTIPNTLDGFNILLDNIKSVTENFDIIKVGLEATGHYSYNLLGFLLNNGLPTYVLNPLHTNLYRKSLTLRKTKTDKADARVIASMLMSCVDLKPYTNTLYQSEELKSMTRYRFDKVSERAKLKTSVSRLVTILFPELEALVPSLHMKSVYTLLSEFPSAQHIANAHLTRLANLLSETSKGHYGKDKAIQIRGAARRSVGSVMPAKSLELRHTIKLIADLTEQIDEIETEIKKLVDATDTTLLTVPGLSYSTVAMILAEVGDFSNFATPDKVLAFAGMSPSTYQSGQLTNCYAKMEKRGSKYLRYALYNAAKFVCTWDKTFKDYLAKKRAEGKHYNVALSHAVKKLVRLIFALEKSHSPYQPVV